jgi:hypothetical protein
MAKKNTGVNEVEAFLRQNCPEKVEEFLTLLNKKAAPKKAKKKVASKKKAPAKKAKPKKKASPKLIEEKTHIHVIRKENTSTSNIKYDENGNKIGVYMRREPICVKPKFVDDGKTDKNDKVNKKLKKLTVRTERRPPALVKIVCAGTCGRTLEVSKKLLHNGEYTCDRCIMGRIRNA